MFGSFVCAIKVGRNAQRKGLKFKTGHGRFLTLIFSHGEVGATGMGFPLLLIESLLLVSQTAITEASDAPAITQSCCLPDIRKISQKQGSSCKPREARLSRRAACALHAGGQLHTNKAPPTDVTGSDFSATRSFRLADAEISLEKLRYFCNKY